MKNKLFLIFICLILLSISTVSAGDINQTKIDEVDNSVLSTSNDVIVDTISASEDGLENDNSNILNGSNAEIYVSDSVKNNGDGSKINPFKDLKSALDKSENGDTIYIAPGTYAGVNNTGLTISKSLSIANWMDGDVIFTGDNEYVFDIHDCTTSIIGLTFVNCKSTILSILCNLEEYKS